MKRIILIFLFLAACSTPPTATPPPTPQVLHITYPPALTGWEPKVYACAQEFPQLAVFADKNSIPLLSSNDPAIRLHIGVPKETGQYSYSIAQEEIVLIASTDFPLDEISILQLQGIFNGQLTTFQSLGGGDASKFIQAWTFPAGDETRLIFEQAVFSGAAQPIQARIAPDPTSMLEAIATTAGSIGYLPGSALSLTDAVQSNQFKTLALTDKPAEHLRQPVIAQLTAEPNDLLNAYLQCLQDTTK